MEVIELAPYAEGLRQDLAEFQVIVGHDPGAIAGEGVDYLSIRSSSDQITVFQLTDDDYRFEIHSHNGAWCSTEDPSMWSLKRAGVLEGQIIELLKHLASELPFGGWRPGEQAEVHYGSLQLFFEFDTTS